ncbi:MAG: hypothetical protein JTT11_04110 [Candidatus Brockarchaeota archaeon]|nr:hypothetical protein [Candidatus Brockarchaeota archaeon]
MKKLVVLYAVALLACALLATARGGPVPGLSVTMGTTISAMYSTMLGSVTTTISSSTISSTMLASEEPFRRALSFNQVLLPIVASAVLCFAELARSSYGKVSERVELASRNLMSEAALLSVLCLTFVAITLYYCVRGVFW